MRAEVWLGEREGMVISLRRRMLVDLIMLKTKCVVIVV